MQSVIGEKLIQNYARQNKIEASQKDIDHYMEKMEQFMRDDRNKRETRSVEIQQQLKAGSIPAEQKKQLQSELDTLESLHEQDLKDESAGKQEQQEVLKIRQTMA